MIFNGSIKEKVFMKKFIFIGLPFFTIILMVTLFSPKKIDPGIPIPKSNSNILFGIDISENQGTIDWERVVSTNKHHIKFVFIRATMGKNRKDAKFQYNWNEAKKKGFIVGAYHYYDPNENSLRQAKNYLNSIRLQPGDFIPVVDIERLSRIQSKKRLRLGLQRWLNAVEARYGVRPIIYSGHSFFSDYLLKEFSEYPLWVAAYSDKKRVDPLVKDAAIHQFSEKIRIPGIKENTVDGNDIRIEKLNQLLIR